MNKLLTLKNESEFKKNSADFYLLTVYSKEILGFDKFRLDNYINLVTSTSSQQKKLLTNQKYKLITFFLFSCYFVKRFKSIMVVPAFYFLSAMCIRIFSKFNREKYEKECLCYFCIQNEEKEKNLWRFDKYYKIVDKVIERNPRIKTWAEFEKAYKNI